MLTVADTNITSLTSQAFFAFRKQILLLGFAFLERIQHWILAQRLFESGHNERKKPRKMDSLRVCQRCRRPARTWRIPCSRVKATGQVHRFYLFWPVLPVFFLSFSLTVSSSWNHGTGLSPLSQTFSDAGRESCIIIIIT